MSSPVPVLEHPCHAWDQPGDEEWVPRGCCGGDKAPRPPGEAPSALPLQPRRCRRVLATQRDPGVGQRPGLATPPNVKGPVRLWRHHPDGDVTPFRAVPAVRSEVRHSGGGHDPRGCVHPRPPAPTPPGLCGTLCPRFQVRVWECLSSSWLLLLLMVLLLVLLLLNADRPAAPGPRWLPRGCSTLPYPGLASVGVLRPAATAIIALLPALFFHSAELKSIRARGPPKSIGNPKIQWELAVSARGRGAGRPQPEGVPSISRRTPQWMKR